MLRLAASLGGGVYAVGACTESLGSETGDVGGDAEIDHQLGQQPDAAGGEDDEADGDDEAEPQEVCTSPEKRPRMLPPPLPRAAEGAFSMRAERREGRLILTQVRVGQCRREVFRVERADGRLRLQFAASAISADRETCPSPDDESVPVGDVAGAESSGTGAAGGVPVGGCFNEAGEVAGTGQSSVDIGAVMGT